MEFGAHLFISSLLTTKLFWGWPFCVLSCVYIHGSSLNTSKFPIIINLSLMMDDDDMCYIVGHSISCSIKLGIETLVVA